MGAIYSSAYLTIAADQSGDSNGGCFNSTSVAQDESMDMEPMELRTQADKRISSVYLWDPGRGTTWRNNLPEIDGGPLAERGWVCQERILSPRILHYTSSQLFWECRHQLLAEDGLKPWATSSIPPLDGGTSTSLTSVASTDTTSLLTSATPTVCGLSRALYSDFPTSPAHLLETFYTAVISQSYSPRRLTHASDKLPAISGIARVFHKHLRSAYAAGIWLDSDLAWGLSWRRRAGGPLRRRDTAMTDVGDGSQQASKTSSARKGDGYRSPSFSWACLDAPVEWPLRFAAECTRFRLLDSSIKLAASPSNGNSATTTEATSDIITPSKTTATTTTTTSQPDPFGRVAPDCSITLHGHLSRLSISARKRLSQNQGLGGLSSGGGTPSSTPHFGGAGTVDLVWEIQSQGGKWIGSAYLDAEVGPGFAAGGGREEEDEAGRRGVACFVLSREEGTGHTRVLLLEGRKGRGGEEAEAEERGKWEAYVRIGVGEIFGYEREEDGMVWEEEEQVVRIY